MVQIVTQPLLPANMINDHLRLQVGVCQFLNGQIILLKFTPRCKCIRQFNVAYNRILIINRRI